MDHVRCIIRLYSLGLLLLVRSVYGMCPVGCECTADQRHSVQCDGSALNDIPSLLDPRTRRLSMVNCGIRRLDADVLELYAG
ncbi:unnamed protein product [Anisakis simplex]|uniref:LRRNT domain-containing protein n=1 Tax=Anisakis simplex TaxID=6269 RepID=A0A0M3JPK1_ANISI|nr:unnamed protein product [Anisakis simplex]VDK38691.1 unnamed protein product [Anisakis simplex]